MKQGLIVLKLLSICYPKLGYESSPKPIAKANVWRVLLGVSSHELPHVSEHGIGPTQTVSGNIRRMVFPKENQHRDNRKNDRRINRGRGAKSFRLILNATIKSANWFFTEFFAMICRFT